MTLVRAEYTPVRHNSRDSQSKFFIEYLNLSILAHSPFLTFVAIYAVTGIVFLYQFPGVEFYEIYKILILAFTVAIPTLLASAFLALVICRSYDVVVRLKSERPIFEIYSSIRGDILDIRRYIVGLPMLIALLVYMSVFTQVKQNIPNIIPFSWDEFFMKMDYWLHLGNHPWELLQPLIGFPFVSFLISKCYAFWMIVMWMVWMWLAFDNRMSHLRSQFFFAYMLIWMIGGGMLALLLSSTGPVFYGTQGLIPDPYAPLMGYLHEADKVFTIDALFIQDLLWKGYTGEVSLNAGISAMPSMHNATSLLFVLAAWPVSRKLGILLSVFAAIIFVGSIHLGWHYAVDAYLAYAVTFACWWVAGRLASWHVNTSAHRRLEERLLSLNER